MKKKKPIDISKLPVKEQKIVIAQDILKAIEAEQYVAERDGYINIDKTDIGDLPVKENWDKVKQCTVCQIGACIMSITKYKNVLTFDDLTPFGHNITANTTDLLASVFTPKEICLMEVMYEGNYNNYMSNIGRDNLEADPEEHEIEWAKGVRDKYPGETASAHSLDENYNTRMIAICNHIIKYKGIQAGGEY
jgi:hypothetical protein